MGASRDAHHRQERCDRSHRGSRQGLRGCRVQRHESHASLHSGGTVGSMKRAHSLLLSLSLATCSLAAQTPQSYFTNWPAGLSPQEVGKRVAEHFVPSPHHEPGKIHYSEAAAWYGALTYASLTRDPGLQHELIRRFDPLLPGGAEVSLIPPRRHVDDEIFGIIPMEIGIQTHDAKYTDMGLKFADRQWENPQPDGLSAETRYWVDDMYMLTILQLEAYRATGDRKYLDRDAKEMAAYLDKLQQTNGLFYHAPDVPFVWGRGRHGRDAPRSPCRPPAARTHPGWLPQHDGGPAEVSRQGRHVAADHRSR